MDSSSKPAPMEKTEEREALPPTPDRIDNEKDTTYNIAETAVQDAEDEKPNLAAHHFQPVLEILQRLEQEDPKLASQGARLLGLYRRMWESCVSKHVDNQRLEDTNRELRTNNALLCHEADLLKHREGDQLARLHFFEQALEESRQRLLGTLKEWNAISAGELALPAKFQNVR